MNVMREIQLKWIKQKRNCVSFPSKHKTSRCHTLYCCPSIPPTLAYWHTSRNCVTLVRYSSCSANLISEMARGERGSCRVAGSRRAIVTSSSTTIPSTAHRELLSCRLQGYRGTKLWWPPARKLAST